MKNTLTVIIPFFNEEMTIGDVLRKVLDLDVAEEIFLVDDGSTDKSKCIVQSYLDDPKVKYFYKPNNGKGSCLHFVLDKVKTSHLIMQDADQEYNPNDILKMFELAIKNPQSTILGSRELKGAMRKNKYKIFRFGAKFISFVFSKLFNYKITDIATGYLIIPLDVIKSFKIFEKGFGIEVELISKIIMSNNLIIETPINYYARSINEGKKIKLKDGIRIFYLVFKFRFFSKV